MQPGLHALSGGRRPPILAGMPAIRIAAAADLLGVSPSTLRAWERRHGFPAPRRSEGGHRQYELAEVEALQAALRRTADVGAAVGLARAGAAGPAGGSAEASPTGAASRLADALAAFRPEDADRAVEASLAVRGLERTLEEVLLPAAADAAAGSAEAGFAWRWSAGWLAAQARLAGPATRSEAVLVFDASAPAAVDGLHVQALELVLRRAGARVLGLPAGTDPERLGRALRALEPGAVVLAGAGAARDTLARLVFAARRGRGDAVAVAAFRGALGPARASTVPQLSGGLVAARDAVLALAGGAAAASAAPSARPAARRLRVAG
jgi:hypothetical protein